MNKFQARILANNNKKGRNYIFYGVPNDDEGKAFMTLVKKYLNPNFSYRRRFRKEGTWQHSVNEVEGDSFVVYIDTKDRKTITDAYAEKNIEYQIKLNEIKKVINN